MSVPNIEPDAIDESVDTVLEAFTDRPDTVAPDSAGRFVVSDDSGATWAMRKLRAIRARQAANVAIADAEKARINEWLLDVNRADEQAASFFTHLLTEYGFRVRAESEGKRKSIKLPYGTISTRTTQATVIVDNAEEFISWAADEHPDWLLFKPQPVLAAIKAATEVAATESLGDVILDKTTGEIVPGLLPQAASISVTVTPDLKSANPTLPE